jgi:DnaK suppressor protein
MSPPLTPEQVEDLRQDLERELRKLKRSMGASERASEIVELDQTAVGRLSRMDSLQSQSMAKSLRERENVKLTLILGALERVEQGRYGLCLACDKPIEIGRLTVFPESRECVRCGG